MANVKDFCQNLRWKFVDEGSISMNSTNVKINELRIFLVGCKESLPPEIVGD